MRIIVSIICILLGVTAFICVTCGFLKANYKKGCSKEEIESNCGLVFVGVAEIIVLTVCYTIFFG